MELKKKLDFTVCLIKILLLKNKTDTLSYNLVLDLMFQQIQSKFQTEKYSKLIKSKRKNPEMKKIACVIFFSVILNLTFADIIEEENWKLSLEKKLDNAILEIRRLEENLNTTTSELVGNLRNIEATMKIMEEVLSKDIATISEELNTVDDDLRSMVDQLKKIKASKA